MVAIVFLWKAVMSVFGYYPLALQSYLRIVDLVVQSSSQYTMRQPSCRACSSCSRASLASSLILSWCNGWMLFLILMIFFLIPAW